MTHPYEDLPPQAFWRSAVADRSPFAITGVWQPKFPIERTARLVTAGSCFAQHISRRLAARGFNWVDSEPSPPGLTADKRRQGGYGVFSFRTGNIYTAALLRQWVAWAFGAEASPDAVVEDDGRFYDPFRPTIPEQGLASAAEVLEARTRTLACIRDAVATSDVFVFTLGLTEGWVDRRGWVYPVCPGTIRGAFSTDEHLFRNFTHDEILADLTWTFDLIRRVNPGIRFLLTVSPVPLTATASGGHVLVATIHSKSVLRAAAGQLAAVRDDVDYFPSFELVSAFPFRGMFYEPNLRGVTTHGVDFVMAEFFRALGGESAKAPAEPAVPADAQDVVCEDAILDYWSRRPEPEAPPRLLLIGDSHLAFLGDALQAMGIPFAGGSIMAGSQWHGAAFDEDEASGFLPHDGEAARHWAETRATLARWNLGIGDLPVVTNIGSYVRGLMRSLVSYMQTQFPDQDSVPCNQETLEQFAEAMRGRHFQLLRSFVARAPRVCWLSDPPVPMGNDTVTALIDTILTRKVQDLGCITVNARALFSEGGLLPEKYRRPGDFDVHGNALYYADLAKYILPRILS